MLKIFTILISYPVITRLRYLFLQSDAKFGQGEGFVRVRVHNSREHIPTSLHTHSIHYFAGPLPLEDLHWLYCIRVVSSWIYLHKTTCRVYVPALPAQGH